MKDSAVSPYFSMCVSVSGLPRNADEIFERTVQMRRACAIIPPRRHLSGKLNGYRTFYIAEKYKLSYCRVAKAGSTYMSQLFMTLAGIDPEFHDYGDAKTMFQVPKEDTHVAMKRNSALWMYADDKRVQLTTSFLVARNPYSRLFSLYVEQIYLPSKWTEAGRMVANPKRKECGNDVTFNEFLSHLADSMLSKKMVESQWAPIFTLCLPCDTHIDIIAKQESFIDDVDFILGYAGVEREIRDLAWMAAMSNRSTAEIPYLTKSFVRKGHFIHRGCMTEQDLAKRLWSAFKIQGYIHDDIDFPEKEFENIPRDELEEKLAEAVSMAVMKRPLTERERTHQRHIWKLKFWKGVDSVTLQNIQAAYYEDFSLFGYDIDPHKM